MNLRIIQGSIREYWRRSKGFEKSGLKQKYGGKPDENSVGIGKTSLPKGFKWGGRNTGGQTAITGKGTWDYFMKMGILLWKSAVLKEG